MSMRAFLILALLGAAGGAQGLEVSNPARFECRQGNCSNGQGVVWDAAQMLMMQGDWRNGATIPGQTYTITLPAAPGKVFKQVYGADGLLERGDAPRSLTVVNGVVPYFSGTFKHIQHAFARAPVAVISSGVYNTGTGFEYRGRFEYLPSKGGLSINAASGYFVFYGDLVDTEENESESGLYISDDTIGGTSVRFVKGDPSYLAVLQDKYQRDMQLAQGEFRKQESEQKWRSALSIIGNVALAATAGGALDGSNPLGGGLLPGISGLANGYTSNVGNDIAIGMVSSMFNQNVADLAVQSLALQAVGPSAGDSTLNGMLTQVVLKAGSDVLTGNAEASAAGLVNAMGNAVIEQTAGTVGAAIGDSTGVHELGAAASTLMKQNLAVTSTSEPVSTSAAASGTMTGTTDAIGASWQPDSDEVISARLGNAAQLTRIAPPSGSEFDGGEMYATNDGVYLSAKGPQGNQVLKRTLGRGSPAGWLSVNLPKGSSTFAVSSLREEEPNAFAVVWAVYGGTYGMSNLNNQGTSFSHPNTSNVHRFVPIGARSTSGGHWAIAIDGSIYRKRTGGSRSTEFNEIYELKLERPPVYKDLAATSEDGLRLYLPGDDLHSLISVVRNQVEKRYDLSPFGSGPINTLIAAHDRLWIGYGNQIITLRNDKLTPFARLQTLNLIKPSFCLSGRTLYTADGRVFHGVDIQASEPRSYLQSTSKVKPEEIQALNEVRTAVNSGVYCADSVGSGPVIYSLGLDLKTMSTSLLEIRPY